jgi:two-component system, NtrC family, nitrogen regulation sensor histidine kinase NtrY
LIEFLKTSFNTKRHLLIAAAWLFGISFLVSTFFSYRTSLSRAKNQVEDHLQDNQAAFHKLLKDTALLYQLHTGTLNTHNRPAIYDEPYGIFIYSRNDLGNPILTFWNTHTIEPNITDVNRNDGSALVKYQNGSFVLDKHTLVVKNQRLLVIAIFPVKWDYFLENRYLNSEFAALKGAGKLYNVSPAVGSNAVKDAHKKPVFSLVNTENKSIHRYDNFSIVLWILGTLFLFFYINAVAHNVYKDKGLLRAVLFIATVIIVYRLMTIFIPFPFDFKKLELFDSSIYASSMMLPSLGDLLLNSLLLFWLVIFIKTHFISRTQLPYKITHRQTWILNAVISAILILSAFLLADIVQSLVEDSQISFDVTDFSTLNIYTVVSFFILTLLLLSFYHISHILLHFANLLPAIDFSYRLLMSGLIGLVVLVFSPFDTANSINVIVLAWLMIYLFALHKRQQDWRRPIMRSSMFIFWIMFFSLSVTSILVYQTRRTEKEERRVTAERLAIQTDPSGENLMGIAITNLENKWLGENYHRFDIESANKFLKDSLITANFAGYLNKFDTRIYTYDSLFHPLFNEDSTTYPIIKSLIQTSAQGTRTEGLYYYENGPDRFSYLFEKEVKEKQGNTIGHLFIVAKPKRYKSEALYPELFSQSVDGSADMNSNYSYAVYNNGKLINSYNDFNFSRQLSPRQMPVLEIEWREVNDRSELWYKAASNKVIVVAKKNSTSIEAVTLFAYFFFTFLFIVLLFHAGRFLVNSNLDWNKLRKAASLSIRNQIHLTIIFISLFSFIIIGVATISFFVVRFNKANNERLGRTIQVMANEMESRINAIRVSDDQISLNDLGLSSELDKVLAEVSDIHNVDVNFYDGQGSLRLSTIPYLYNKGIMNRQMDPVAFFEMNHNRRAEWLQKESVGNFSYLSIYIPIKDESQQTFAYLNIPYLNSQRELNEEISNFLVTLINLNAFIFLLAGAIAFFLANKITSSFNIITAKMREVNLGRVNEEITWKNRDEIGALVNEYNTMVRKLEASADALARSEREGAWREMARQVAHEIKNPLTPMKLSIQHLQRAIDAGSPNVKELSQRMASTLIEQIDQLAKIAADFSQFANIGNIRPEVVDIEQVLQSLIGLYSSDGNLSLQFNSTVQQPKIFADKTQINRLFTNLIKNAIEASNENGVINIHISINKGEDNILIAIRDEGAGIPADMQKKIFSPNFTTKSSGTGLGLAICKAIVEKANGTIWFVTDEANGTSFFVSFPVYTG